MTHILNVGISGCGEVTQILHIPTLQQLCDRFAVTALHDASRSVMARLSPRLPGAAMHARFEDLIADPAVDAVLIAGPNATHAPQAIGAMRAGKHVLIEKPMCMTLAEADALAEAEAKTGRLVQIGYMRRHAAAFEQAVSLVAPLRDQINYARVHDIIGPNAAFIEATSNVIRGNDIPPELQAATAAAEAARLREAIGVDEGPRALVYRLLLGLSSHDISAMREMLGPPSSVLNAAWRRGGLFITATFAYDDFICQFATGIDRIARFDAHLEVWTPEAQIRVDYDTPYIRHQPTRLTVTEPQGNQGVTQRHGHPQRADSFLTEWQRFHIAVATGARVKTDIADAREDLALFSQMMKLM